MKVRSGWLGTIGAVFLGDYTLVHRKHDSKLYLGFRPVRFLLKKVVIFCLCLLRAVSKKVRLLKSAITLSIFGARIGKSRRKGTWRGKRRLYIYKGVGFAVLSHNGGCSVECCIIIGFEFISSRFRLCRKGLNFSNFSLWNIGQDL